MVRNVYNSAGQADLCEFKPTEDYITKALCQKTYKKNLNPDFCFQQFKLTCMTSPFAVKEESAKGSALRTHTGAGVALLQQQNLSSTSWKEYGCLLGRSLLHAADGLRWQHCLLQRTADLV